MSENIELCKEYIANMELSTEEQLELGIWLSGKALGDAAAEAFKDVFKD